MQRSAYSNLTDTNHSMLQKTHGSYKPVRDFTKLMNIKVANSGFDTKGAFTEFMNNDVIRPLSRPNPYLPRLETPIDSWALKTDKNAAIIESVPKLQQYKDYYFPDRSKISQEEYRSKFLKTDHVSIRVPKIERKEGKESYLNLKSQFGPHTETENPWVPQGNFKTINNRSSVEYNIITHNGNKHGGALIVTVSDHKVINRKKGVAEITDLGRVFNPNFSKRFAHIYEDNKTPFHLRTGIFSHMYDAAHRSGNIVMPFKPDLKKK
jgi:hypothetical protein